jgi:DNA-directed RNA polymerase subunit K/omega
VSCVAARAVGGGVGAHGHKTDNQEAQVLENDKNVLRSSNIPNKYELIVVASKEARRLNELSRQTGLNLGGKVTNVALEETIKGNVLYRYKADPDEQRPDTEESAEE